MSGALMVTVFPLLDNKRPACSDWKGYRGPKPTTRRIGVVVPEWAVVFDLDLYKGVTTAMVDAAVGCKLDWEAALLQTTPSGGAHYGFVVPAGHSVPNSVDVLGVTGFDTRAQCRGYIATGEGYQDQSLFGLLELFDGMGRDVLPLLPVSVCERLGGSVDDIGDTGDDGLLRLVAANPIGLSLDEIRDYVKRLPDEAAHDSASWFRVMRGIFHETQGSDEGWQIFDEFSQRSPSNYNQRENRNRWRSFAKKDHPNPITFASVIRLAGGQIGQGGASGLGVAVTVDAANDWLERAKAVETLDQFAEFKREFSALNSSPDLVAMVAGALASNYGKQFKLSKTEIKRSLNGEKKKARKQADDGSALEWCADWVYLETRNEFCHSQLPHYRITPTAFNIKFHNETAGADMRPVDMALAQGKITTYADLIYWPGAGDVVEYRGMTMLNSYRPGGVEPCSADELTLEDEIAIGRVTAHIAMLFPDERERQILLDWLFHVSRNIGKRVAWMPVIQGPQGCGKTFIGKLLQVVIGHNMRQIDPGAIGGRFNGWAADSVVNVIEEIRVSGTSKYEILDKLKPLITNDEIGIEEKGRDQRTVPNHASYMAFTNHLDAIPIDSHDRRYCMLATGPRNPADVAAAVGDVAGYFSALFATLDENAPALAHWLTTAPISDAFSPRGVAPVTNWRNLAIELAVSPETDAIREAIDRYKCEVVNDQIVDVTHLQKLCEAGAFDGSPIELPKGRSLSRALLDLGYEPLGCADKGRLRVKGDARAHRAWVKGVSKEWAKNAIREFFGN